MSARQQFLFECEYSIEICTSAIGLAWAIIRDEHGDEILEQDELVETRADALDWAENELAKMFEESEQELTERE